MPRTRSLGWVTLFATCLGVALAPGTADALEPPARVSVLTMGPGDHPFTRFGHNALLLEWDGAGRNAVFNYGTFEFDGLQGVTDFMAGRFRYWLSVSSLENTVNTYGAAHRSLAAQELALTVAERAELFEALRDNARPEHRYYDYDYYRDNCSTRVRDVLDRLLGGELRRQVVGPGRLSFRQHTLRLVGDTAWLYLGLDLALGAPTDRPISRWDELFLPRELHDALGRATRPVAGQRVPLVRSERVLLQAERGAEAYEAPERGSELAGYGAALGIIWAALGWGAGRWRALRIFFGVVTAAFGTCLGLLGSALAIFWASKHWAAHANRSLLACPPWMLALGVLGGAFALGRVTAGAKLRRLLGSAVVTTSALLLLSLTAGAHESMRVALLFLPLWAGWWAGVWLATRAQPGVQAIAAAGGGELLGGRAPD